MKTRPNLSLIAAVSTNNVIGKVGTIPWSIPADLLYFKEITSKHIVIMGRKTFESINSLPLIGRLNIVISSQFKEPTIKITAKRASGDAIHPRSYVGCGSLEQALYYIDSLCRWPNPTLQTFVIGGSRLYEAALPMAFKLYLTHVNTEVEGDTFFPLLKPADWMPVSDEPGFDDKSGIRYNFTQYVRRNSI